MDNFNSFENRKTVDAADDDVPNFVVDGKELERSVIEGNMSRFRKLLPSRELTRMLKQTLLFLAVKHNRIEIAKYLLKNGCEIQNGVPYNELMVAFWNDNLKMIEMLLENGGDFRIFTYTNNHNLHLFGDFSRLILAIRIGKNSAAANLIKKLDLSEKLTLQLRLFAQSRGSTEIAKMLSRKYYLTVRRKERLKKV